MRDDLLPAFETFLVQDVILTLGNLRGSLAWLADGGTAADPATCRAGFDRLDRQIELLQDRARAMCPTLAPDPASQPAARPASPAAYAAGSGMSLEGLLRDALGEEAADLPPLFRSRRGALG